ncbi:MAG: M20/M25/M40 family metallo-hydrolase [Alphaproteobacteria bacterium]|nr:M20/M25/M40 family metallo-hydrolase [Alphaproteobacteria bacterium]
MVRRAFIVAAGLALVLSLVAPSSAAPSADERARALEIYRHIVDIDSSVETYRVPEVADYLAGVFKDGGFSSDDIQVVRQGKTASLVVRYRGDGAGGRPILLMAHMDVVAAHRADWERDPFKLIEEKGFFFGRGTGDNKSGVAALTATFLTLRAEKFVPTRDLIIAFTGDEETQGLTATALVREHRALIDAEFALNSDGGGGQLNEAGTPVVYYLQTSEKTFASFKLTAHNSGGHSSTPRRDNAIYDIADVLGRVRGYAFPVMWNDTTIAAFRAAGPVTKGAIGRAMRRFAAHPGDARAARVLSSDPFHVGQVRTTCVATLLQGGHADNALPQSATATVNCRIFPGVSIASVQAKLQQLAGAKIEVAPLESNYIASDASPLRKDVVAAVSEAVHANYPGVPIVPSMSSGASDGVFYRAAGIPTYGVSEIFIKDSDDFSHGLNERVPVDVFYAGLTHWRVLLTRLAGRR